MIFAETNWINFTIFFVFAIIVKSSLQRTFPSNREQFILPVKIPINLFGISLIYKVFCVSLDCRLNVICVGRCVILIVMRQEMNDSFERVNSPIFGDDFFILVQLDPKQWPEIHFPVAVNCDVTEVSCLDATVEPKEKPTVEAL